MFDNVVLAIYHQATSTMDTLDIQVKRAFIRLFPSIYKFILFVNNVRNVVKTIHCCQLMCLIWVGELCVYIFVSPPAGRKGGLQRLLLFSPAKS